MYDTPGYIANHSLLAKVEKEVIKIIMPKVEIKPRHYRLGSKDSLSIGGLVRLDVLEGKKQSLSFYFANPVKMHRQQLERADQSFFTMIQKRHLVPTSKYFLNLKDFDPLEIKLEQQGRVDLAISGYGWISIPAVGQTLRLLVPKGVFVTKLPVKI
jgi:ribosome biogenesis GTPase A